MKQRNKKKGGDRQSMASLKRSEYFEQLNKIQQDEKLWAVGDADSELHETTFKGMFTIRFEKGKWWEGTFVPYPKGFFLKYDEFLLGTAASFFMRYVADLSGCEMDDLHWITTNDVEKDGVVNTHILFNYLPLEINGFPAPKMEEFPRIGERALNMVCARFEHDRKLINVHFVEAYNDEFLVNFFEKWNPGEPERQYGVTSDPEQWITHDMMCSKYDDLEPSEKAIMDLYLKK